MLDDFIVSMLNMIGSGPVASFSDLVLSPGEYNSRLYQVTQTLHNTAVKPITSVVLAIMAVLMLASNSTKFDADRDLGIRIVAGTMFKIALILIATQQAMNILGAIDQIATETAAGALSLGEGREAVLGDLGDQNRPTIEEAGTVDKIGLLALLILPFVVSALAGVLGTILIFVRFIQLYLLTAFASLPIAFFAHDETKSIGITYLKRYAGIALNGVVLIFTVILYQGLLGSWVGDNFANLTEDESLAGFVFSNYGSFFVAPLVLIFLLTGASRISKSLVGE